MNINSAEKGLASFEGAIPKRSLSSGSGQGWPHKTSTRPLVDGSFGKIGPDKFCQPVYKIGLASGFGPDRCEVILGRPLHHYRLSRERPGKSLASNS